MLRTYRTFNSTVRFSKFKFYNKLLSGVILFKITPGITWIQLLSLIYMCEREREREGLGEVRRAINGLIPIVKDS